MKRFTLAVALVTFVALVVALPAFGMSATTKQVDPGISVRTIWDSAQVACYKLPNGVNHNGYIHMELKFKPNWADFDIYLLNAYNQTLSEEMGYMAAFTGREVIDYRVTNVVNKDIVPGDPYTTDDDYMVGDAYYVVVVAFSEQAKFQVSGYYPQIDLSVGSDTRNQWNYYLQGFRKPSSSSQWTSLHGPNYGYPYDYTPTSEGNGEAWLQWPANVTNKTVDYDPLAAPSPANMEQYLYSGSNWETVFEDYGDGNWSPADQGGWYGLRDTYEVLTDEVVRPLRMLHYIPSLYLVASDPMQGGLAAPKTGVSKMGYKTTLIWPENLRITSAPAKVKKNAYATFKGTFALDRAWQAGATITLQKNVNGTWKKAKTVKTDANGKWTAKVKFTGTASYRAMATGDDATGLAVEYSLTKRVNSK